MRAGVSLLLSLAVVFGIAGAWYPLDFPIILFVRSVHDPLIEWVGDFGSHIGHGVTLSLFSLGLAALGHFLKWDSLKWTGWYSLLAHAVVGILVQIPKHLLGRPRPRWTHQGTLELGPSLQGGLDAFPSGHASASFAVAAVLARFYPKASWLWYGLGLFVSISRIMRGSHFPTDVVAGALMGFVIGYVVSRPLKEWRTHAVSAMAKSLPLLVFSFALVWISVQQPAAGKGEDAVGLLLGGGLFVAGLWLRRHSKQGKLMEMKHQDLVSLLSTLFLWVGLAFSTGSILVIAFSCAAGVSWWFMDNTVPGQKNHPPWKDVAHACLVLGMFAVLQVAKGSIPLLPFTKSVALQ